LYISFLLVVFGFLLSAVLCRGGSGFGADPLSKQHCREQVLGLAWCGTGEQHPSGGAPATAGEAVRQR